MAENPTQINETSNTQPFECDEPVGDDGLVFKLGPRIFDTFQPPEDDEFESAEAPCESITSTVVPKALNNINNVLTKVLNTQSIKQSFEMVKCV